MSVVFKALTGEPKLIYTGIEPHNEKKNGRRREGIGVKNKKKKSRFQGMGVRKGQT